MPRRLKVSRQTARLVSKATYHDFVLALRELVANAHDAASPNISIDVDLSKLHRKLTFAGANDASRGHAVVADLGRGMDEATFNEVFLNVGRSNKTEEKENRMGRPLIGQFGIGFISALPFCEEVIVETRIEGSDKVSGTAIRSRTILENLEPDEDDETPQPSNDHEFPVDGWQREAIKSDARSFTRVVLNGLTSLAVESIDAKWSGGYHAIGRRKDKAKISDDERLEFLAEWLSRILPLGYPDSAAKCFGGDAEDKQHEKLRETLLDLLRKTLPKGYTPAVITFNGKPLHRRLSDIHFPPLGKGEGPQLLTYTGQKGTWMAVGVVWSPLEPIDPVWTRGVAIRVADMSIGDPQYWGLASGAKYYGKLQHITGEFHVTGLNGGLRLDREGFIPGAATDEFLSKVRLDIARMDGALQDIASVVQQVRVVKKQVEAAMPKLATIPKEPTALARGAPYLERLAQDAETRGVKVERRKAKEAIAVPTGERRLRIDSAIGDALVSFKAGKDAVRITVDDGKPKPADAFANALLQSKPGNIAIAGRHEMFTSPSDFRAYLRLLAVLRIARDRDVLTDRQVVQMLEILEQTFR